EVLEQVKKLAGSGYKEIVLTGIHLGGYGQDLRPKIDLTELVETIAASGLISRLRLSSLDPREVPDRLIDLMALCDVICPHLHICAQAGDDKILQNMRRNYNTGYYRDLLARVRERLPDSALGSDIIVGFPGESERQFESSLEYFASLPLTYFHVFPYSSRRGTPAASLRDLVPIEVKKSRARRMRALGVQKKRAFCSRFIGRRLAVLIEDKLDVKTGARRGFTRNYLPVNVCSSGEASNEEVAVELTGFDNGRLAGTPCGVQMDRLLATA
ncbi:MAG TPA: radical SAM protein, partial [Candidatus Binatia bacterium]